MANLEEKELKRATVLKDKPEEQEQDKETTFSKSRESLGIPRILEENEIEPATELYALEEEVVTNKKLKDTGVVYPVYRQYFDFGSLPNATVKSVDLPVTLAVGRLREIIKLTPIVDHPSSLTWDGFTYTSDTDTVWWYVDYSSGNVNVTCNTDWNATTWSAKVIVEYTKI